MITTALNEGPGSTAQVLEVSEVLTKYNGNTIKLVIHKWTGLPGELKLEPWPCDWRYSSQDTGKGGCQTVFSPSAPRAYGTVCRKEALSLFSETFSSQAKTQAQFQAQR